MKDLRTKRDEWLGCLSGKDRSSIHNQIQTMLWDAASFRVVNEARRLATKAKERSVELSGLVHGLINRTFVASQASAIRRIVEPGTRASLSGKAGVHGLLPLLADMKANVRLLTRRNLLESETVVYEYTGELKDILLEHRHAAIDGLCGVKSGRTDDDCVAPAFFESVSKRLRAVTGDVSEYANKFVAHAATPDSRAAGSVIPLPTLYSLWTAHEAICKVTALLLNDVFGDAASMSLAHPIYDVMEHIEKPLVAMAQIDQLQDEWDKYEQETSEWSSDRLAAFREEILKGITVHTA